MSICGYNEKIGDGLGLLFEGVAEALGRKAASIGGSAAMRREIIELVEMISVMSEGLPGVLDERARTLVDMFVGLNILARALFSEVDPSSPGSIVEDCGEVGKEFVRLLELTEAENASREYTSVPDDEVRRTARHLATWVLSTADLVVSRSSVRDGGKTETA